jgi:peptide/nickel transport system permease protein
MTDRVDTETVAASQPSVKTKRDTGLDESYYMASQWVLMRRKFFKHKMAIAGMVVILLMYFCGLFAGFLAPYDPNHRFAKYIYSPPMKIHFIDEAGKFYPGGFVYGYKGVLNRESFIREYAEDRSVVYPIKYFTRGQEYKFWGLFRTNIHLFSVEEPGMILLFGTDDLGRDLFSRNLHAARLSLSVGLVGVAISFVLGCLLGGLAGFYGGAVDMIIQRLIEFLLAIPRIPFWLALAAALPPDWPIIKIYFGITIVLATIGWTGLARVVRGKLLQTRQEDFVMAAKISGTGDMEIITKHLLPSFMSYLIVNITLRIPQMILGETALSFLGVGLRAPAVSWGVLLQGAQNVQTIALHPWLLLPALFVIIAVLAVNFLGDGLRDAADPYK